MLERRFREVSVGNAARGAFPLFDRVTRPLFDEVLSWDFVGAFDRCRVFLTGTVSSSSMLCTGTEDLVECLLVRCVFSDSAVNSTVLGPDRSRAMLILCYRDATTRQAMACRRGMQTIIDNQFYKIASKDLKVEFTFKTGNCWGNLMKVSINIVKLTATYRPPTSALRKDVLREVGHG
jgi:hypothetical protein